MERKANSDYQLESEVDIIRRRQYSVVDNLCEELNLQERFGFSEPQMKYFKASLAYDKLNKQVAWAAGWAVDSKYIPGLNVVIRGYLSSVAPYRNKVNNLALKDLREAMEERRKNLVVDEYPKSGAIRNSANQISIIIAKCNDGNLDIKEEFGKKFDYLKNKVLGLGGAAP